MEIDVYVNGKCFTAKNTEELDMILKTFKGSKSTWRREKA